MIDDSNDNEIVIKSNIYKFEIEFINNENNKPKKLLKNNKIFKKLIKLSFIKKISSLNITKLIRLI